MPFVKPLQAALRSLRKFSGISAAVVLLSGCDHLSLATANLLSPGNAGTLIRDVPYGEFNMQRSDIYLPATADGTTQLLPTLIFLHGGSWRDGDKSRYRFVAHALTAHGFMVVVPDYRKFPEVVFPAFVEDSAQATAWVVNNIDRYGGDPRNVFVAGHSAGAHMGALLLADATYLARHGLQPQQIRGFIGLAGPYSFTPLAPDIIEVFGAMDDYSAMQVDTFVDGGEPPMLLLHGEDDVVVARANLDRLEAALRAQGGEVTSRFYPDTRHGSILAGFTGPLRSGSAVVRDSVEFMRAHLQP